MLKSKPVLSGLFVFIGAFKLGNNIVAHLLLIRLFLLYQILGRYNNCDIDSRV